MLWIHGPYGLFDYSRLPRERRHEPFTPRLPRFLMEHPSTSGVLLTGIGICGNWLTIRGLPNWPGWALFPGAILAILCMLAMMIGLGIIVVRVLEPVIGTMDLGWDAEPVATMGIPFALQRTCERLGYWTAEDLSRAVDRGSFPWKEVAYDERMQIERAAHLWKASVAARRADKSSRQSRRSQASLLAGRRGHDG